MAATINNANLGYNPNIKRSIAGIAQVSVLPIRLPLGGDCNDAYRGENEFLWDVFDQRYSEAINYAKMMAADVILLSPAYDGGLAAEGESAHEIVTYNLMPLTTAAIAGARGMGILLVAPGGHFACDPFNPGPSGVVWPALLDDVIAVSGVENDGEWWDLSCEGEEIELAAPVKPMIGLDWLTSGSPQSTTFSGLEGTSFGAATVAGVAALIKSYRSDLDGNQIRKILVASADGNGAHSDQTGWGIVNPVQAIDMAMNARPSTYGDSPIVGTYVSAMIGHRYQPATDVDGMGNTHVVFIGDTAGNGNKEVFYQVVDQAGYPVFGPERVEARSGLEGDPSEYPDIFVDGSGNAHIAWIERADADGEIYYVEYGPDHSLVTPVTHQEAQFAQVYNGPIENLNILRAPNTVIYYVYDQMITTGFGDVRYIILNEQDMYPSATIIGQADDGDATDPTADIAPSGINGCNTQLPACIYFAFVVGDVYDAYVFFKIVDTSGAAVVQRQEVEYEEDTYVFSAPTIDVDPDNYRTALAWSRLDVFDTDGGGFGSSSISFAWVESDGTVGSAFPKTLGVQPGGGVASGGKDPSVSTDGRGGAAVTWTGYWENGAGPNVVYVEVGASGLESTFSPTHWSPQIKVGSGPGAPLQGDPLYPQVASAKNLYDWDVEVFDRTDGHYRFVWLQQDSGVLVPYYSSTRPTFSFPRIVSPVQSSMSEPDVARGADGSYHVVYTKDLGGGNSEVRYAYWPPGQDPSNGPPVPPGGFDIAPCCWPTLGFPPSSWNPRVLVTSESVVYEQQVMTQNFVYVLFLLDMGPPIGPTQEVWITKFQSGSSTPFWNPAQFGSDNQADPISGTPPDSISDLDATIFTDHESDLVYSLNSQSMGSYTNPVNTPLDLPLEPVIAATWVEHASVLGGGSIFDHLMFGAVDKNNGMLQDETMVRVSPMNEEIIRPSIAYGPGDRTYLAYIEQDKAYLQPLRVALSPIICGPPIQVSPAGADAYSVVIRTDIEFDRWVGGSSPSRIDYSDNQVHAVMGIDGPTVGPGAAYYDLMYTRWEDIGDEDCSGTAPLMVERVELMSILPADTNGDRYLLQSIPDAITMEIGNENRPVIAFAARLDLSEIHSCGNCGFQVFLVGLGNSGLQEYFTASRITYDPVNEWRSPALTIGPFHRISVVEQLQWNQPGVGTTFSVTFHEAEHVDYG